MDKKFSHLDNKGNARIVDISKKKKSSRFARAHATVWLSKKILSMIILVIGMCPMYYCLEEHFKMHINLIKIYQVGILPMLPICQRCSGIGKSLIMEVVVR